MKQTGLFGKGSGKLGSAVFAISGGEQIVREYNPRVSNPNTAKQVGQRAKFKLLSQLAAVFAGAMAFKKDGLKSARNQFIAKNYSTVGYSHGMANINLASLQISDGMRNLQAVEIIAGAGDTHQVKVTAQANDVPDVCLVVIANVNSDEKAQVVFKQLVTEAAADNTFTTGNIPVSEDCFVYAVGLFYTDASKREMYSNIEGDVDSGEISVANFESAVKSAAVTTTTKTLSA